MATSRQDKAQRSPPCDLTRGTITVKGHGDISKPENQARFAAALLGLPQPTEAVLRSLRQSSVTPPATELVQPDARAGEGE